MNKHRSVFLAFFMAFLSTIPGHDSFASDEIEIVSDIIRLYQPLARRKLNSEIVLFIDPTGESAGAFASFNGPYGSPRLRIYTKTLEVMEDDWIVATACHELGHFFGDLSYGRRFEGEALALEGEADYFGGSCLLRYTTEILGLKGRRAEDAAIRIAEKEAQAFEQKRLDWRHARYHSRRGMAGEFYPDPRCRLLTVIHGIQGLRRPSCWLDFMGR